ncbi:MAG: hypothetical protein ACXWC3_14960, partial [Burkholderiales bacterium]
VRDVMRGVWWRIEPAMGGTSFGNIDARQGFGSRLIACRLCLTTQTQGLKGRVAALAAGPRRV